MDIDTICNNIRARPEWRETIEDFGKYLINGSEKNQKIWSSIDYIRNHDFNDELVKSLFNSAKVSPLLSLKQRKKISAWLREGAPYCQPVQQESNYERRYRKYFEEDYMYDDGATSDEDRRWCD